MTARTTGITVTESCPCQSDIDRFCLKHGDAVMRTRALKTLRMLAAVNWPLRGKSSGWAAGVIYAIANRDRFGCGLPGLLNSEVEQFFGVSMVTIRRRAAQVDRLLRV